VPDAIDLYDLDRWGLGYFSINDKGEITCLPMPGEGACISLMDIIGEAGVRGLSLPLQIRFQDLLRHRVRSIHEAFNGAIKERSYHGEYRGVFPLKVNQLREVIEEILEAGRDYRQGLEVGSKAELVAALAVNDSEQSLIICNGYKDESFLRLALLGQKLGRQIIVVIEKIDEVGRIIEIASKMDIVPQLGMRMRLNSKGSGKWAESSGDNAKFGLTASEALATWERLKEQGLADSFQLIHFHIGSQVPDIKHFKQATREAARYYAQFIHLGASLTYIDVGGGLGVDYDGSGTDFHSSKNYSLAEYANTIVDGIQGVCDEERVPHPTIVSECGRSTVAHHAVLVVEAFANVSRRHTSELLEIKFPENEPKIIRDILDVHERVRHGREVIAAFHALQQLREESLQLFDVGLLDLVSKAKVEELYWEIAAMVVRSFDNSDDPIPEEIQELAAQLSHQYVCNFSIFQSLLDNWAIGQLFPIIPIHRLDERPEHKGTLVDITCDSEGKITSFIDMEDVKDYLLLHSIGEEPYYLGIFLTGAYQDVMGDQHNLFGRINEVHVFLDRAEEKGFYVEEIIDGSTVDEVLRNTQYDKYNLIRKFKESVDRAIRQNHIKATQGMKLLDEYRKAFSEYTYLK
jgi:arginine decarboxylase